MAIFTKLKKHNRNNHGFALAETLLVVVILALMLFAAAHIYNQSKLNKPFNEAASASQVSPESNKHGLTSTFDKTYANAFGKFTIQYPSSWKLSMPDQHDEFDEHALLTSPSGTGLYIGAGYGSWGGDCQPAATDKPFSTTNLCATKVYYSAKTLPIDNIYHEDYDTNENSIIKKSKIQVTESYTTQSSDSTPDGYTISLTTANRQPPLRLNEPRMGTFVHNDYIQVYDEKTTPQPNNTKRYVYLYGFATKPDKAFLDSDDADTVTAIFQTLKVKGSSQ